MKSAGERAIANWLIKAGVEFEYERPYEINVADAQHSQYRPDFFYPSTGVYHEHWALASRPGGASRIRGVPPVQCLEEASPYRQRHDVDRDGRKGPRSGSLFAQSWNINSEPTASNRTSTPIGPSPEAHS